MTYIDRILVTEDDALLRRIFESIARLSEIEIDMVESAERALDTIKKRSSENLSYPVILTDIVMPGMKGLTLINKIWEFVDSGQILQPEIYVMSGACCNYDREISLIIREGKIKGFYEKPFDTKKIFEELNEIKMLVFEGRLAQYRTASSR